ncbi:MAG: glycosyl hydrolase-related protein [Oscillospiraceae bacterium]|jgi:alpha-mannosidase|nr:glycosyl hydrolase-related protein [Oscillospiraceae bacterium]
MSKPTIYTVATAHLDTSWRWTLEQTIEEFIPATLTKNFALFEKYPDYTFSFEGAYRYELMEEYYPELFERLKQYVAQGRWRVAGSSYENGDVNIPSPEALFRNILLGNRYFAETFGKRSVDIYLPDCFGFGWALPGIAAHANLKGFTTQKLTWGSAEDVPFALGRWQGPDGGEIFACPDGHTYVGFFLRSLRKNYFMRRALGYLKRRNLFPAALILHGVGDKGGAPKEISVATVSRDAAKNSSQTVQVRSAAADDIFRDVYALPESERARFPVHKGEWLLTDHGTGCYTSRIWSKRWNRKAEQLAQAAEHAAVYAALLGRADYPLQALNAAWKRVIAHQFHDDMTGTSNEVSYQRNWNDLMVSQQEFARLYASGVSAVAGAMHTGFAAGQCVAVCNPTQWARSEAVAIKLPRKLVGSHVRVLSGEGRELPCQLQPDKETLIFQAPVPPLGVALFDLQVSSIPCGLDTGLRGAKEFLENNHLRALIDENGDIASIYSKDAGREVLAAPIRLALFDFDGSPFWPQWELYYPELKKAPSEYPAKPEVELIENGPARVAVAVTRRARGSVFRQIISLSAGSDVLRVENEIDWQSPRTLLKVEFPLEAANKEAAYDLGFGVAMRGVNTPRRYEVPAQQWADITDKKQGFGVSILSDCKTGWDKPNENTLRLTAVYTPRAANRSHDDKVSSDYEANVLDFGRTRFAFGIYPHAGGWQTGAPQAGACLNQPLAPFYPAALSDDDNLPTALSFGRVDGHLLLRALKQAEDGNGEWIVRVQEANGYPVEDAELTLGGGIAAWRELYASEEPREAGPAQLRDGTLRLPFRPFEIRTFALTLNPMPLAAAIVNTPVALPAQRQPLPGGLWLPDNAPLLRCAGQTIPLPAGRELHLAAASFMGDKKAVFTINGAAHTRMVCDAREAIGAGDLPSRHASGYVKNAYPVREFWHLHNAQGGDLYGAQAWFFDIALPLGGGPATLVLPEDSDIVVLEAYTRSEPTAAPAAALFDQMERLPECEVHFTPKQNAVCKKRMKARMSRMGLRNARSALRVRRGIDWRI